MSARVKLQNYVQQTQGRERIFLDNKVTNKENSFNHSQVFRHKTNSYHQANTLDMALLPPKSARPPLFGTSRLSDLTQNKPQPKVVNRGALMQLLLMYVRRRKKVALDMIKFRSFTHEDCEYELISFETVIIETQQPSSVNLVALYEKKLMMKTYRQFNKWKSVSKHNRQLQRIGLHKMSQHNLQMKVELLMMALHLRKFQRRRSTSHYIHTSRERSSIHTNREQRSRKRSIFE